MAKKKKKRKQKGHIDITMCPCFSKTIKSFQFFVILCSKIQPGPCDSTHVFSSFCCITTKTILACAQSKRSFITKVTLASSHIPKTYARLIEHTELPMGMKVDAYLSKCALQLAGDRSRVLLKLDG